MVKSSWESYYDDVCYEVWMSGGDIDAIDYERCKDAYYNSDWAEECAANELRCQSSQNEE